MLRFIVIPTLFAAACGLPCESDFNCPFESACVEGGCRYIESGEPPPLLDDVTTSISAGEVHLPKARESRAFSVRHNAGRVDAGGMVVDAGVVLIDDPDAGVERVDAGGVEDAGVALEDAGITLEDGGAEDGGFVDAGVTEDVDAGLLECPAACDNSRAGGVCEIACF